MNVVLALSILCPWVSRGGYGQAERSGDGDESLVIRIHVIMTGVSKKGYFGFSEWEIGNHIPVLQNGN